MSDKETAEESHDITLAGDGKVYILGELVGAYALSGEGEGSELKGDELRPYCRVKFGGVDIHCSSPCSEKGEHPIWTISTGSLFLIDVSPITIAHDELEVSLWTKRRLDAIQRAVVATDTFFLGKASISGRTILSNCEEQRLECQLEDLQGHQKWTESTVALRFRVATPSDVRLLRLLREQGISPPAGPPGAAQSFRKSKSKFKDKNPVQDLILSEGSNLPIAPLVTEAEERESQLVVESLVDSFSFAFKAKSKYDQDTGLRKVRVKPGPDPDRVAETKFLSPFELSKETLKPSQKWIEAGSGSIGTVHLEILSCHDLPNVDVGEAVGNLTDCFVCAVFEDAMVQTPVIDDELSPHWMPWTQRAFRFSIVHPTSTLYIGVLDFDLGPGSHEPIGRAAVNLSNLRHNMEYTLKYKLYPNSDLTDRKSNGSIKVRLRIEYPDEKAALLASLQPRPQFHVNTKRSKSFWAVRYTCFGEYDDEEKFSWPVLKTYIFEILEYWGNLKFYLGECFWSLVFWRNQVKIYSTRLPIYSAFLFISGCILVERPSMIVPFLLLFVASIMLASMNHRLENPSPWKTCTSFLDYLQILTTGKAPRHKKDLILPCEYEMLTEHYETSLQKRRDEYQSELDARYAMEEQLMTIGNENIQTEIANQFIPVELLERLGRYQGIIGRICMKLRVVKSVITWEDSIVSFWITAFCLFIGLVTLILPWAFLLRWIGRIVVWCFLGPHMRFVDFYLNESSKDDLKALDTFRRQRREARIRREEAVKLKDMKCLAYGKYVTLTPGLNLPRHYDRPLHESSGRYVPRNESGEVAIVSGRIPGQQLYGTMIPQTKDGFIARQKSAQTSRKRLLKLEEQVARIELIQDSLSSRSLGAPADQELPDDLGYEINLVDEEEEGDRDEQGHNTSRMPKRGFGLKLSLSQTGFRTGSEKDELFSYRRSRCHENNDSEHDDFIEELDANVESHGSLERADEARQESRSLVVGQFDSDDATKGPGPSSRVVSEEPESDQNRSFTTPLQTCRGPGEPFFMTPSEEEEKKAEETVQNRAPSPMDFLQLNLKERDEHLNKEHTTNTSQCSGKTDYSLSKEKGTYEKGFLFTALKFLGHSVNDEPVTPGNTDSQVIRKSLSNVDQERCSKHQGWIKKSPTDTLLYNPSIKATKPEEGLEIVAMGRLRTVGEEHDANDDDDDKRDDNAEGKSSGLSAPYESSNGVQVALYRP